MAYYQVGKFIRNMRKRKGISQGELSRGFIDQATLSRIENGHQLPSKYTLDVLLERLGINAELHVNTFLSGQEYEVFEAKNKLVGYIRMKDFERASQLIAALECKPDFHEGLNWQFLVRTKASVNMLGQDHSAVRAKLLNAIHETIPNFDTQLIGTYLLMDTEIKLVNELALSYHRDGQTDEAIRILYALKESIDVSCANNVEKAKSAPMVLYNLSKYLGLAERFDEAITICDAALAVCRDNNNLAHMPKILFNKAYCQHHLGIDDDCEVLLYQAYWGCDMLGKQKDRDAIREYAKNEFGIELDPSFERPSSP